MSSFQLRTKLGSGGFGEVWEAVRADGSVYAVKRLDGQTSDDDLRRFRREVRLQASLDHPHIVSIVKHDVDANPPWIMMPKANSNLDDYLLKRHGESELWVIFHVAAGLEHAHKNGIVHRDLKPGNILIFQQRDGTLHASLCDFGLGVKIDRTTTKITRTNARLGTIAYMAPEQVRIVQDVDAHADVYSLGKVLYEVLSGDVPYPDMDLTKIPTRFTYIINRATRAKPEDRYPSVEAFVNDLKAVSDVGTVTKAAESVRNVLKKLILTKKTSKTDVEPLVRLLLENTDDMEVLLRTLPHINVTVVEASFEGFPKEMRQVFAKYDHAVSGTLSFDYCDTVADFYARIFDVKSAVDLREPILQRLTLMGYNHSRWHVGTVLGELVKNVSDEGLAVAYASFLGQEFAAAHWAKKYILQNSPPKKIADAIRALPVIAS